MLKWSTSTINIYAYESLVETIVNWTNPFIQRKKKIRHQIVYLLIIVYIEEI